MAETIRIEFQVDEGRRGDLLSWVGHIVNLNVALSFRSDFTQTRPALRVFADAMEMKLRKNDHKTGWRDQPIQAHIRLLLLELEEFKVALEFFKVKDARNETIDIANFAMILYDKLGLLDPERNMEAQTRDRAP